CNRCELMIRVLEKEAAHRDTVQRPPRSTSRMVKSQQTLEKFRARRQPVRGSTLRTITHSSRLPCRPAARAVFGDAKAQRICRLSHRCLLALVFHAVVDWHSMSGSTPAQLCRSFNLRSVDEDSLSAWANVYPARTHEDEDVVVKRTASSRQRAEAMACWTRTLAQSGIAVVTPTNLDAPNPQKMNPP